MRINAIQTGNQKQHTNFKMKITASESVKYAVLTSRELMEPCYKEQNRGFVQEFCNSLARILKSNQAERVWITTQMGSYDRVAPSIVDETYKSGKTKRILWLDSIQKKEHKYGGMLYSQEGGNIMRTIIEYAKTIKDVPEQKIKLKDKELKHYAYKLIGKDLHDSVWGFEYPEVSEAYRVFNLK